MKINIPCNQCICLAVCKHKTILMCHLLYDYMDVHFCMKKRYTIGLKQYRKDKKKVWKQIQEQFRKQDINVLINTTINSTGWYLLNHKKITLG